MFCPSCGDNSERCRKRPQRPPGRGSLAHALVDSGYGDGVREGQSSPRRRADAPNGRPTKARSLLGQPPRRSQALRRHRDLPPSRPCASASLRGDRGRHPRTPKGSSSRPLASGRGEDRSPEATAARRWLRAQEPEHADLIEDYVRDDLDDDADIELAQTILTRLRSSSTQLTSVATSVAEELLAPSVSTPGGRSMTSHGLGLRTRGGRGETSIGGRARHRDHSPRMS